MHRCPSVLSVWLLLLGLLGMAGCASSSDATGSTPTTVPVTGSDWVVRDWYEGGFVWYEDGFVASDPRLTGTLLVGLWNGDAAESPKPNVVRGLHTLTNEGGTWYGTFTGRMTGYGYTLDALLLGAGDYDGLQFRMHEEGDGLEFEFSGTIEQVSEPGSE